MITEALFLLYGIYLLMIPPLRYKPTTLQSTLQVPVTLVANWRQTGGNLAAISGYYLDPTYNTWVLPDSTSSEEYYWMMCQEQLSSTVLISTLLWTYIMVPVVEY